MKMFNECLKGVVGPRLDSNAKKQYQRYLLSIIAACMNTDLQPTFLHLLPNKIFEILKLFASHFEATRFFFCSATFLLIRSPCLGECGLVRTS